MHAPPVLVTIAASCERMAELLAFALALESDASLQSTLHGAAPNAECAVMLGEGGPFLRVANGKLTGCGSLAGEPPPLPITFESIQPTGVRVR